MRPLQSASDAVATVRGNRVTYLLAGSARPLEGHGAARVRGDNQLRGLRAEAAEEIVVGRALDWADVGDKTDGTGALVVVGDVARVFGAVDDDGTDEAVASDEGKDNL